MKRTLILLAVVLLMVVAYELWNYNIGVNKLAPSKQDKSQASLSLNASTTHGTVPVPANIAISGKYEPWHGSQSQSLADPRWAVMHEREKADPNWQGKMSIEFYGKVLDEREQPIAGVDVEFGWTDMSVAGSTQKKTITDANGLFSLSGVKGKFLAVTVNKDGYYVAPGNRYGYEYAGFWDKAFFESDSSKPVIFHLRKKGVTESIIYHQKMFGFKPDGTQYFIDLKYGRKTANDAPSGGDFMVRLVRSETGNPQKYDWSLTIQGIGQAGITDSRTGFLFEAPESGYQKTLHIDQKQANADYQNEVQLKCFVLLSDGKTYGRIEADVLPKYNNEAAIDLKIYVNPSGSRNLEFDPAKQTYPR